MFSINLKNNASTAIQIKDHVIRYVTTKGPSYQDVESFGETILPSGVVEKGTIVDEVKFNQIFQESVGKWNLKNKQVMFLVPDVFLFFRKLSIPDELENEEIRGYLNFEIGASIHLPFEDPYFDFHILPKASEKEKEILFFAIPEKLVKQYEKKFEQFKLKPVAADVSAISFFRLFSRIQETEKDEHYLLIEYNLSSINLSIFHDNIPIFMREQPYPLIDDEWIIHTEENVASINCKDLAQMETRINEQLAEIDRVSNFYKYSLNKGEKDITTILLTGDHPLLPDIKKQLMQRDVNILALYEMNIGIHKHFHLPLSLCLKEV
ncbi:type IV pilus assembly protein PilM [Natronobacillus azotifigens]|uniref:Pilus assembly protein PilM n=1 Tax=Natronobacillus azotifigens TaxID=472978 RepID=A0A9J6RAM2_9BACI|nr:pilus assembly protein PilM [Natronobacillus azotifigens]